MNDSPNTTELRHNWSAPGKSRLTGKLSIRPPKPDEPANDHSEPDDAA